MNLQNPMSRFNKLVKALSKKGAENPEGLAAFIGRKKYGEKKFEKMALSGKRQKELEDKRNARKKPR